MHTFALITGLCAALLLGCGDDTATGGAGGSGAGGSGGSGGDGGSGAGSVDPTPILERPAVISHDCTEERPLTHDGAIASHIEGLISVGGEFFVTHESEILTLSKVDLAGDISDSIELVSEAFTSRRSTTLAHGGDLVTIWTETGDGERLVFARVNTGLELVEGPTEIDGTASPNASIATAISTPDGIAMLYGGLVGTEMELRFVMLGEDGAPTSEPVVITNLGESYGASASAALTNDGAIAVTYSAGTLESSVYFVVLDADGTPRFEPRRISRKASDTSSSRLSFTPRNNLIAVGDAVLVAYMEENLDYVTSTGHVLVRIAEVDAEGNAALHALQAPVEGQEDMYPTFVSFEDRVGLAWTTGSIIWICGGCIGDHDMHFVLLDPQTLVPSSEVATHLHMTNGAITPLLAVDGEDIATAANLDFHASTLGATGAMRCVAAE